MDRATNPVVVHSSQSSATLALIIGLLVILAIGLLLYYRPFNTGSRGTDTNATVNIPTPNTGGGQGGGNTGGGGGQ